MFSELKQEIQSKERRLNPEMNESQAAAAVRRCSSFRAAVDNRLSSSADNTPKSHSKSKLIKKYFWRIDIELCYYSICLGLSGNVVFHSPPTKLARVGDIVGDLMRKVHVSHVYLTLC